jgi:hypothetical protein
MKRDLEELKERVAELEAQLLALAHSKSPPGPLPTDTAASINSLAERLTQLEHQMCAALAQRTQNALK